jgi:hypothetical protein
MKIMLQAMITNSPGLTTVKKERLTKLLSQLPEGITSVMVIFMREYPL